MIAISAEYPAPYPQKGASSNVLGSQLCYFLLQAIGIGVERKFIQEAGLGRVFLWGVVLIPSPLVINEGVLRVTGLFIQN